MLLAQQAILANSVVLTSTRIAPVSPPVVVGCPLIGHGPIRYPEHGKLHIPERAHIAVCILEFCVKWRMDAVSVRLCSPSQQGEAIQKRNELFHLDCLGMFVCDGEARKCDVADLAAPPALRMRRA